MSEIVITGMGITTALGRGVAANRAALLEERSGIGQLELFPTKYAGVLPCAEIKEPTAALAERLNARERGVTRTSLLALDAFEEACADAGIDRFKNVSLVCGTTVGGMCLTDELYEDANMRTKDSAYLTSYDCGSVALYLQERFGLGGVINSLNTACSSSANALAFGARLLRQGRAKKVIAGGTDALAKFTINGFNALHILSPEPCTPFDGDRKGLNLGEGAAFLVLERAEDAGDKKVYARLTGWGNSNDAFHPSSLSEEGDGPFLAMEAALQKAGLQPADISYINAHGTATENNDEVESRAMIRLFGQVPAFASTKAYTGHTLGAAGAVEAIYSVLSLLHGEAYPNLRFANGSLEPLTTLRTAPLEHVMSNSFGFGGNCSSLIFSKA
ncbi:beta-ketoacyl-[acyl-carrier-protein] synthase family protein [Dinghuibacter silviterrae]|uniref:beta-ketoacyl-[acyl-carrier-protein] synthase family protein n=1 Tax=Dinghuibacter silviterrae TaxID=1539049 RepID=UPI0010641F0F|nr:beta-ketoacyl-[acyl-carrier-protein] synthase family protein [Dinghuibacter silviterrae]